MIEQLFGSKTRVKLLQLFYSNPNRSFFVREITRKIDEQINSVRRELSNLLNAGIITSETNNNKLYYEVNQKYEYYDPLREIFGGGVKPLARKKGAATEDESESGAGLDSVGHVELALYTGQFTRDASPGVDFLVVGNVNPNALKRYVTELEKQEGKDIRYTFMTLPDFEYRRQINDRFIRGVLHAKYQILADTHGLLSKRRKKAGVEEETSEKSDKEE
ncbi:MAG TPA: winged helix-turn-helix domain-containing protein [Candidatus Saccharimonadales bacterium]|nr:winged helix-turn-helix domain-containing protein [Candidatus Saccharimonadales bacterium]